MFNGAETLVIASSFDAYASGSDGDGNWKQYRIYSRVRTGTSNTSDYLEGFLRNNTTKIYQNNYAEVQISSEGYATNQLEDYNYVDLKGIIIFSSLLFASNGIPQVKVTKEIKWAFDYIKKVMSIPKLTKAQRQCGMLMIVSWKILDFIFQIK